MHVLAENVLTLAGLSSYRTYKSLIFYLYTGCVQ